MKFLNVTFILTVLLTGTINAQDHSTLCRQQMNVLSYLCGKWSGEAKITQPGGVVVNAIQDETIEYKLDSLILQVEGIGRNKAEPTNIFFHALAYINYNAAKNSYEMKSFLKDGKQTDAYFKIVESMIGDLMFPAAKSFITLASTRLHANGMRKVSFRGTELNGTLSLK